MREINIDDEDGSVLAYVLDHREDYYKEFIRKYTMDKKTADMIVKFFEENKQDLLVIRNIQVAEDKRGQGLGSFFLKGAMHSARVPLTMLISDKTEKQKKGFKLDDFYKSNGFVKITETGFGQFMVYPKQKALQLKEYLFEQYRLDSIAEHMEKKAAMRTTIKEKPL